MKRKLFFRKTLAFLSAAFLLLNLAIVPASYAEELITVSEEAAEASMTFVSGLGLTGSLSQYEAAMSRADFAQILANMMRYENFSVPDSGYRDVTGGTKNASAISFCVVQGYMSGSRGLFRPDDAVTYMEAAKALVELTGMNYMKKITTDSAYMSKATSLGINRSISGNAAAPLSVGAAVKMIHNTLSAESMKMSAVSAEGYYTDVAEGKFMEVMLSIEKIEGLLTKTRHTGLYTGSGTNKATVEIDEVAYNAEGDWSAYLGCHVEAYIDYSGDEPQLLFMLVSDENETVELTAEDIVNLTGGYVMTYYPDETREDEETARLARDTVVVYNGRGAGTINNFTRNELMLRSADGQPMAGTLRLIDYDSDGVCEVMVIMTYEIMYVSAVDKRQMTVIDEIATATLNLSAYSETELFISYEGGDSGDFDVLAAGQVLNVAKSRDGKVVYIIISESTVEDAVIEEISGEEYTIGGEVYKASSYFTKYFAAKESTKLRVGWTGTVKLDISGKIAAVTTESELYYGYLTGVSTPKGLSTEVQLKLFTNTGEEPDFVVYECAERLQLNHQPVLEKNLKAMPDLCLQDGSGTLIDQLIRFSLNAQEEISSIITADRSNVISTLDFKPTDNWYNADKEFALNFSGNVRTKTGLDTLLLGNKFNYSLDGQLWIIPTDVSNESGFLLTTASGQFTNDSYYDVELYNVDEYGMAEQMIYRTNTASASFSDEYTFFVSDIYTTVNADGEIIKAFEGYNRTIYSTDVLGITTKLTREASVLDGVQVGDVIQYIPDAKGVVTQVRVLHSYKTAPDTFYTSLTEPYNYTGSLNDRTYGQIMFAAKTSVGISVDRGQSFHTFTRSYVAQWIVHDTKTGKTTIESDPMIYGIKYGINNTSRVFIFSRYNAVALGVLYV